MNAEQRPSDANDAMVEELVAYLDGELDPEASRDVERRLSQDADYRQRLRQLQQSWDLLDRLPKADIDPSFTQSTVALIAARAADDVDVVEAGRSKRRKILRWIGAGGVAAAFLVGYALVYSVAERHNRRLLRDLPVIERIDEYRYAESLEFLQMLDREGLFVEEDIEDEGSGFGES
jgi:anti-sigma factor RsiW